MGDEAEVVFAKTLVRAGAFCRDVLLPTGVVGAAGVGGADTDGVVPVWAGVVLGT